MNLKEIITNPIELEYFEGLLSQLDDKKQVLTIATPEYDTGVYPTAIAPRDLMRKELPFHSYEDIKQRYSTKDVVDCTLWLRKMHGGLGSSIDRSDYLKKYGRITPGSKSTDLYIETKEFGAISLAEAQIIQASKKTSSFRKVVLQDLVNNEVKPILDEMWDKHSHLLNEDFQRLTSVVQQKLPTIKNGELTTQRIAPAGHGIFGYEVFKGHRPEGENLIACIGNGEDLSSTPDRAIVNWMLTENIPVVMVTTTKTKRDMKGGQIALKVEGDKTYLTIVEKAQAEQAGQLEYFEKLGLRKEDEDAFFNTNLVLVNFNALSDCKIALPDLIKNQKGEFVQLEGAMGSVLLNSDRLSRDEGKKLVHILNVNKENRTKFFNPIKKMDDFDFILDNQSFNEKIFHFNHIQT
ncbi:MULTISPECIES: UTP--glucose-1-phosphate uridylyltransferase [unclassified Halobacteriovorax]|uniref:UTP--glucose-1-phosphate uridylyltransferase n=1 Tax=unclassified Halobacteriovorax TaxID=2639665 RepID=UPI00399957B0